MEHHLLSNIDKLPKEQFFANLPYICIGTISIEDIGELSDIKTVKILMEHGFTINDFRCGQNSLLLWFIYYGHLDAIKLIGYDTTDFNYATLKMALVKGQVEIMKHICSIVQLTADNFMNDFSDCFQLISFTGNITMIQFMHEDIGLRCQDFRNHDFLYNVSFHGYLDVVKYLHKKIGFTQEMFDNMFLMNVCQKGHCGILAYLHKNVGISKFDVILLRESYRHQDIIKYFCEEIGMRPINYQDDYKYVLQKASSLNNVEVIKYVCKNFNKTESGFDISIIASFMQYLFQDFD